MPSKALLNRMYFSALSPVNRLPAIAEPAGLFGSDELDRLALDCGWSAETHGGRSVLVMGSDPERHAVVALRLGAERVHMLAPEDVPDTQARSTAAALGVPFERSVGGAEQMGDMPVSSVLVLTDPDWLGDDPWLITERLKACLKVMRDRFFLRCERARGLSMMERISFSSLSRSERALACGEILARLFHNVLVVRRVMPEVDDLWYRAEVSREAARVLSPLPHVTPLDISLSKGLNYIELVSVAGELRALKVLPFNSPLERLGDDAFDGLMESLSRIEQSIIALPQPIGPRYRGAGLDGRPRILIPYIDIDATRAIDEATVAASLILLRRSLRSVGGDHVERLREVSDRVPAFGLDEISDGARRQIEMLGLAGICRASAERMRDYDRSLEDCVIHGDPHFGNIVSDRRGGYHIIDLDLMRTGTAFSDLLMGLATNAGSPDTMIDAVDRLKVEEGREPLRFDFDFTIMQILGWLVVDQHNGWETAPEKLRTITDAISKLSLLSERYDGAQSA